MPTAMLTTALLMALLGGAHCAAMCGGIALAMEGRTQRLAPMPRISRGRRLGEQFVMHLGRVATYCALGGLMGAFGAALWRVQLVPLQRGLFLCGNLLMIYYGIRMMRAATPRPGPWPRWVRNTGSALSRLPPGRGKRCKPAAPAAPPAAAIGVALAAPPVAATLLRRLRSGLLWGLVPCGMSYGVLPLAILAGTPASGALVMLVFGLGTLPNLMLVSHAAGALRHWSRKPGLRAATGLVVVAFGVAGLARLVAGPNAPFCLIW